MIDLFMPVQKRSGVANPAPWLIDMLGGGDTYAGVKVNAATALEWVFDAVQVRSQTLASLPFKLYRQKANGDMEPARAHPLYRLAYGMPHPDLTSMEFRGMMNAHLDIRGNAYAQIVRDGAARIVRLVPLHPDRVTPRRADKYDPDGTLPILYEVTNAGFGGRTETFSASDILHLRGYSTDGVVGVSPIRVKAETIGSAIAASRHAASVFRNGARPAGVLEHPGKLGPDGAKNLRNSWQGIHGGAENAGKVAILEENMKFHEVGFNNADSQLLESRQWSRKEIASMYRVPVHMLGGGEVGNFTVEQQALEFVKYCMLPIITNWEQRWNASLLSEDEQGEYFFRFNVSGLLRGDTKSRYEAHRIAIGRAGEPGWMTVNEARELEEMNRIEGGDKLFTGIAPEAAAKAVRALEPILADSIGRALRKEAKAVRAILKKPDAAKELEAFYADHARHLMESLAPAAAAARALSLEFDPAAAATAILKNSRDGLTATTPEASENLFVIWETTRAAAEAGAIINTITA